MAREGADITIVYLPEEQTDAEHTKNVVEQENRSCHLVAGDLMDNDTCKRVVDQHIMQYGTLIANAICFSMLIICRHGRIDVLVNNAGKQILCRNFEEINLDDVESTFRSNILQMFAITKYALPHMRKGGSYVSSTSRGSCHRD